MLMERERAAVLAANPWVAPWRENWVPSTRLLSAGSVGWARRGQLTVCASACTLPGRGYSWPGSVSDRTVRGVYLHEVGHVVSAAMHNERSIINGLRAIGGPRVTGYEPNAFETWAETFRLYAGNPALLLAGRPWRFEYMQKVGVRPMARMPKDWDRGLLGHAPQRYYDQCERWIKRGTQ